MKAHGLLRVPFVISLLILSSACEKTLPMAPDENELLDGPVLGLSNEEQQIFLAGDVAFNDDVFTIEKGLGPVFVSNSCGSCHAGDGKGHPFISFTRFGQSDSTENPYATFGDKRNQLQHKAIPGYEPEELPSGAPFSDFLAPAVTGLGFLDAVADEDLIALADPNDSDGDGISGRLHYQTIPDFVTVRPNSVPRNGRYIHRFGKKAAAYDLLHQTTGAYNQDMGIVSLFEPIDPYSGLEQDPEVSTQTINDVVFYLKTLKAPIPRNQDDPEVALGKEIFTEIKCGSCHTTTMTTGASTIDAISNKEFHPYSDLLLHDMGPELDDGYTEGFATTSEWRTPPLWGLGLSANSQGGTMYLLHDGRASSIEEAIQFHGGEAGESRVLFNQLSEQDRDRLIAFLESL